MKILVLDDEQGFRDSLTLLLTDAGLDVQSLGSPSEALSLLGDEAFDIVLCDVQMPEFDGLEFLKRHRAAGGRAIVIMMSAYGSEDAAIAAMKQGAYDYIPKPFRTDEVLLVIHKAAEREHLRRTVASLSANLERFKDGEIVAESSAMRRVLDLAGRAAPHDATVMITGESGTGKEVLSRAIHSWSPRAEGPFVAINCGAIPAELIESELFGHVKGAFTGAVANKKGLFEEAGGGTILLDEIGDLPPGMQVKLLRVIQEREVRRVGDVETRPIDVRILAATARDLEADVADGKFREDLFYRLNVVRIHIPPLRERREDLPALAAALLRRAVERNNVSATFTPEGIDLIVRHDWPGNVRELENAIERATILCRDGKITPSDLLEDPTRRAGTTALPDNSLDSIIAAAEREAIQRALAAASGNREATAASLEISVRSLFYKLNKYGIGELQ